MSVNKLKFLFFLSDKWFNILLFYYNNIKLKHPLYILNFKNPTTFHEKILWLKMYYRVPNHTVYSDKIKVRQYLNNLFEIDYSVPLIKVYDKVEEINFNDLPNEYILKCNHGSSMNIIVRNNGTINQNQIKNQLNNWLKTDYGLIGREYQYKNIERKILIEKLINHDENDTLIDYKLFMFNGKLKLIQLILKENGVEKKNFYDENWNLLDLQTTNTPVSTNVKTSIHFDKMLTIAEKVAENFYHIRVDFYVIRDEFYFSELTFHDSGGFNGFNKLSWDLKLGEKLKIPILLLLSSI